LSPFRSDSSRNSQKEAGPQERQPKSLNTKLAQGALWETKGPRPDDEDDNDAVRTSLSRNQVAATMFTEELFLSIQFPAYQMSTMWGGGGYGQSPGYIWQAQLGLTPPRPDLFCTVIL
jgi:hypothetical protein